MEMIFKGKTVVVILNLKGVKVTFESASEKEAWEKVALLIS